MFVPATKVEPVVGMVSVTCGALAGVGVGVGVGVGPPGCRSKAPISVPSALLAIAALCLVGVWRPTRELVIGAAVANIVLGGFHIAYHAGVTELMSTTDNILSFTSIGLGIVLGLLLLPLSRGLQASHQTTDSGLAKTPHP